MISGRSSETTYEQTENLNPGKISSVTAAPPRTWRRSRTSTFRPARARYAAATRPLCPPPITIAWYFIRGSAFFAFSAVFSGSLPSAAAAGHHVALGVAGRYSEQRVGKVLPAHVGDLGGEARGTVAEDHGSDGKPGEPVRRARSHAEHLVGALRHELR